MCRERRVHPGFGHELTGGVPRGADGENAVLDAQVDHALLEAEATHRAIQLARVAGAPLYIVHLSALQALAEAHTLMEQHEERWWEAEIHRLRGVLLLRQSGTQQDEAETCLRQALDVARRQQVKSLELRAAVSLSRLWQHQGKQTEAHALLAPIYGWFTEGFDTADLQEAKALLEALA